MALLNEPGTNASPRRRRRQQQDTVAPSQVFGPISRQSRPLAAQQRQAARQTRRAANALPSEPQLKRFPVLRSYTPEQRRTIIREQVPRVQQLIHERGHVNAAIEDQRRNPGQQVKSPVQRLYAQSNAHDRQQLRLLFRLGGQAQRAQWKRAGMSPEQALFLAQTHEHAAPGHYRHGLAGAVDRASASFNQRAFGIAPNLRLLSVPVQVARATIEHPAQVVPKTLEGLGSLAVGAVAVPAELAINTASGTAHGDPLRGVRTLADAATHDYRRRYADLLAGNAGAFRRRLTKEGAAPELADVATVAAPEGAVLGRGLGRTARAGALGGRVARLASEPRPGLRVSGGKVVPQELSPNLFRAIGQRAEDAVRSRRAQARARHAGTHGVGVRGLQPAEGEVVKASLRGQERVQRREAAGRAARGFVAQRREQTIEIHHGVARGLSKLTRPQRAAVYHVLQGLASPDDPARAVAHLQRRRAQIVAERQRLGIDVPASLRHSNDEVRAIDYLVANAPAVFGGKNGERLRGFHETELARSRRVEASDPGVRAQTALVRRYRPQGELLGIQHPHEVATAKLAALRERVPEVRKAERTAKTALRQAEGRLERARRREAEAEAKARTLATGRRRAQRAGRVPKNEPDLTRAQDERLMKAQADRMVAERTVERLRAALPSAREFERELSRMQKDLERRRPEFDAAYVASVRRAAVKAGLPEPVFISHRPRPNAGYANFAPGGAKAIAGVKRSRMALFRSGLADVTPEAYVQSLARGIKRKHNWHAVHEQFETHALRLDPQRVARVLGSEKVNMHDLSLHELQKVLDDLGLDRSDYAFWNPGRLRQAEQEHALHDHVHPDAEHEPIRGLAESVDQAAVDEKGLAGMSAADRERFVKTRGWQLVPRAAYEEITAGTRPSGLTGRLVDKAQGLQARILLGTSPAWLQIQVASNALLAGFGVRGNLPDLVKAQAWWRSLPPEVRDAADELLGNGVFEGHGQRTHLGATVSEHNRLVNGWRALSETAFVKAVGKVNPLDVVFRADNAQNRFFKRAVLYSRIKREAYQRMGREMGQLARANAQLANVLKLGPEAQMRVLLEHPDVLERQARLVNDLLGDYTTYTARERRVLKRGVLFYGFLRYSLRMMFFTLPIRHPVAAAVTAKLAQLHNAEVQDLLGGPEAPWAFSRVFFKGEGGKLRSIDLARANPITNPVVSALQEGPKALAGLVSPLVGALADQVYGENAFSGQRFHVRGSAEDAQLSALDPARARILLGDLLSTAFPYREGMKLTQGAARQGDDSLLFSPRPIRYRTADAAARERQREIQAGSRADQLMQDVFPLTTTKADTTRETVQRMQQRAGGSRPGSKVPAGLPPDIARTVQQARAHAKASRLAGLSSAEQQAIERARARKRALTPR